MQQGLRGPRVLGLLLATVVSTTVAHWAAAGHVALGAVAVLTVLSVGPVAWLGARRRPLHATVPLVALLQLVWHTGLAGAALPGMPTAGHHAHLRVAVTEGSASWHDLVPDSAGWVMVAAHTLAAVAVLLAVTAAESAVLLLVGLLHRGLTLALTAAAAHRARPRPTPSLAPVAWVPARPLPEVLARRPLRRGPPRLATA